MPDSLGGHLPDELLHFILIRLDDRQCGWNSSERPLKHGLLSCSLTCRHWAKLIRPILFDHLTLRSAEDVSQLLAFLSGHDFLGHPIRRCIRYLDVVEDQTSSSITWGHQLFLSCCCPAPPDKVTWTIKGAMLDDQSQPTQRPLSLPHALLPRALPLSTVYLDRVTLSGLQLSSVRSLMNFVKCLSFGDLELDSISFREDNFGYAPRARPSRTSLGGRGLSIVNCITDSTSFPFWVKFSNAFLANRLCQPLNNIMEALLEKHLHLLASLHQCEDSVSKVEGNYFLSDGGYVSSNPLRMAKEP